MGVIVGLVIGVVVVISVGVVVVEILFTTNNRVLLIQGERNVFE